MQPERLPPHTPSPPPAQHAQKEPSPTPRSPVVGRWSSGATITRSWRIGSIPLQSIAIGFKALASRVAQAVARPSAARRASESEESRPVNLHSPDRKAVGIRGAQAAGKEVIQQLKTALTDNLIEMLCGPTTETVDASGICKAFEKDALRGTDVVDQVAQPPQALQADLPNGENQGDQRRAAIQTYMSKLGSARFGSDPVLMEAFTKIAHQGAFKPVTEKMGALLGECTFSTPVDKAPLVSLPKTTRRFELHAATVTRDTASLEVSMHLNASINMVAAMTGDPRIFNSDTSEVRFSIRVTIAIDRQKILAPPSSDPTADKKSTEPEDSLSAGISGEKHHPSRLPHEAITLTVADTRVEYHLDPA